MMKFQWNHPQRKRQIQVGKEKLRLSWNRYLKTMQKRVAQFLRNTNSKSYALYRMVTLLIPWVPPIISKSLSWVTPIIPSHSGIHVFGLHSYPANGWSSSLQILYIGWPYDDKLPPKGCGRDFRPRTVCLSVCWPWPWALQKRLNRRWFHSGCWPGRAQETMSMSPMRRSNFEGGGGKWPPIVKYKDCLQWVAQKRLKQSRCSLEWWVGCVHGTPCIRWGADASTARANFGMSGTLADWKALQSIGFWGSGKRVSCAKTYEPILTIIMSYTTRSAEGCAFWGYRWQCCQFSGKIPKFLFGEWVGVFKPNAQNIKPSYYRN